GNTPGSRLLSFKPVASLVSWIGRGGWRRGENLEPHPGCHEREEDHLRTSQVVVVGKSSSSPAALRCQQVVEGIDLGIKLNELALAVDAVCRGLPQRHGLIE